MNCTGHRSGPCPRRVAAIAAVPIALVLIASAPAGATPSSPDAPAVTCDIHALPEPEGSVNSQVHDAAPGGTWLVGSAIVGGSEQAIAWKKGKVKTVPANPLASFDAVNNKGAIAGWGISGGHAIAGVVTRDGYVPLAGPDGAVNTYAAAISGNRVAGHADLDSGTTVPVVWKLSAPDSPVVLPLPDGYFGFSVGIAKKGRVVVDAMNLDGQTTGFVFTKRLKRTQLSAPDDDQVAHMAGAAGTYAAAWIELADQAVVFNVRSGAPTTIATPIQVNAVNASGVLGGSYVQTRAPGLIVDGTSMELPGLVEAGFGTVSAITKAGNPAGIVERPSGAESAVRWTCAGGR